MGQPFTREGDLKDLRSYPGWLQDVVRSTTRQKQRIVEHDFFALMSEAKLPKAALRRFLVGAWPTMTGARDVVTGDGESGHRPQQLPVR